MPIWAIADLHLAFGVPEKHMKIFGPEWENYTEKIETEWYRHVAKNDLVLIPGDISWAMRIEEARLDLEWIDRLPGTKLLLKGNHDYWWSSLSKVKLILPASCHLIQNNSFTWNDVSIGGTRLWDTPAFNFDGYIHYQEDDKIKSPIQSDYLEETQKVFQRELGRLETSLRSMNLKAKTRIVMTHYPPISADLKDSEVSRLLEKYRVDICVFGHLHHVKKGIPLFGKHQGIYYYLTACDYLDFKPILIQE